MPCEVCCHGRNYENKSPGKMKTSRDVILSVYHSLQNFADLLKYHFSKSCNGDCAKTSLHDVVEATTLASNYCEGIFKDLHLEQIYRDVHLCAQCRRLKDAPSDVIEKIEDTLKYLKKLFDTERHVNIHESMQNSNVQKLESFPRDNQTISSSEIDKYQSVCESTNADLGTCLSPCKSKVVDHVPHTCITEDPAVVKIKYKSVTDKKDDGASDEGVWPDKGNRRGTDKSPRSVGVSVPPEVERDGTRYKSKHGGIGDRDSPGTKSFGRPGEGPRREEEDRVLFPRGKEKGGKIVGYDSTELQSRPGWFSKEGINRSARGREEGVGISGHNGAGVRRGVGPGGERRKRDARSSGKEEKRKIDRSDRDEQTDPRRRRSGRTAAMERENRERLGAAQDPDDEEKLTGGRRPGGKKTEGDNGGEKEEETEALSKSKEIRGRRREKADAADSGRRGASRGGDEEGKVLKGDGKRKGRSAAENEGADDSGLMKKPGTEDKSTLDSKDERKKGGGLASRKERRRPDSGGTLDEDDCAKTNGSRYQRRKPGVLKPGNIEIGPPNPIEYQLSNELFVSLGWTVLPVTKTVRKIVQYRARTAKPHLDWFKKRRFEGTDYYKDGVTPFLSFHPDGSGEVFYPNGKLAVRVRRPKNRKYDTYTVFTSGEKDSLGIERESQVLAIFDTTGNGAVFDEDGTTRLSYNQIGGIYTDNPNGLPVAWTWDNRAKKSIVRTVYAESSGTSFKRIAFSQTAKSSGNCKTPTSLSTSSNKEKKVVERKPVIEEDEEEVESGYAEEKSGPSVVRRESELNQDYPEENCHVKIICMKLNEHLSLRILNRKNISLRFSADKKSIRIELGTVLDYNKEVSSCFVEDDWRNKILKCKYENIQPDLDSDSSLRELASEFRKIKRSARQRRTLIAKYRSFTGASKIAANHRRCGTFCNEQST